MANKDKAAPPVKDCAALKVFPQEQESETRSYDSKTLKWRTTLLHLTRGPHHRFDAERWGDHALPSTVSSIERDYGLVIEREWREVPTRFGRPCRVKEYWVGCTSLDAAMRLVAQTGKKKKAGGTS